MNHDASPANALPPPRLEYPVVGVTTAPKSSCVKCGASIEYQKIENFPDLKPTICEKCAAAQPATGVEADRTKAFQELCPPLYQDTDPNHATLAGNPKLAEVVNWKYQPKGLVIRGSTRLGKTRAAWLLIKRLMLEGRSVKAMTCGEFARQAAENAGDGARDWFDEMTKVDVLFVDDLGKSKLTERVESDLFDIIESRAANLKPCLFTTNFDGETLKGKMTNDRGDALISRIREFCQAVNFNPKETK